MDAKKTPRYIYQNKPLGVAQNLRKLNTYGRKHGVLFSPHEELAKFSLHGVKDIAC